MIAIIQPDGEDARRIEQRGVQPYFAQRIGGIRVPPSGVLMPAAMTARVIAIARGAQIDHEIAVFKQGTGPYAAIGKGKG